MVVFDHMLQFLVHIFQVKLCGQFLDIYIMIVKSPRIPLIWVENFSTNTTFIAPSYNLNQVEWTIHTFTRPHCNVKKIETFFAEWTNSNQNDCINF